MLVFLYSPIISAIGNVVNFMISASEFVGINLPKVLGDASSLYPVFEVVGNQAGGKFLEYMAII